ncbi:hypothetical protein DH2020_033969 [Rehmannia glutinosa]|uniref:KIB1-4 beta-propeller domain-containing protein n=1 Tax=Rehmannia glutinosa TaxID=99300 RepID=A0ABR0VDV6_REHGL
MQVEIMNKEQPPVLLTTHRKLEMHYFYSFTENRYHATFIPLLLDKRVLASTHGWLVLVDYFDGDCCLWNPSSTEIIELPRLQIKPYLYNRCVLSKPPTEPDCHILFNAHTLEQYFCKIGDDEFAHHSLREEKYRLVTIASFQGKIYGVIDDCINYNSYKFVSINLIGTSLELIPMFEINGQHWTVPQPSPKPNWISWMEGYLIESPCGGEGELWLVIQSFKERYFKNCDFRVFRVDINGTRCIEIENMGDKTIFIGYNGSGFCCSSSATNPNSIYYTNKEGSIVYIYDLEERNTYTMLACPPLSRSRSTNYWVDLQDVLHQLID